MDNESKECYRNSQSDNCASLGETDCNETAMCRTLINGQCSKTEVENPEKD